MRELTRLRSIQNPTAASKLSLVIVGEGFGAVSVGVSLVIETACRALVDFVPNPVEITLDKVVLVALVLICELLVFDVVRVSVVRVSVVRVSVVRVSVMLVFDRLGFDKYDWGFETSSCVLET